MILERIRKLIPDKDYAVLEALSSGRYEEIFYDFRRFDRAFFGLGCKLATGKPHTPERHLLHMFKILYMLNGIVYVNLLPLLVTIYLLRTRKAVSRKPIREVKATSMYAKVIGKNIFEDCLKRFCEVHEVLSVGDNAVPIDMVNGPMLSMLWADSTKFIPGEKIFRSDFSESRIHEFDDKVKKRLPAFTVSNSGILIPTQNITNTTLEDL